MARTILYRLFFFALYAVPAYRGVQSLIAYRNVLNRVEQSSVVMCFSLHEICF